MVTSVMHASSDQQRWWKSRGRQGLRNILVTHWDPIGVTDESEAADEYDGYLEPVAGILAGGGGPRDVAEYLARIEREMMELGPVNADDLLDVGERVVKWYSGSIPGRPMPTRATTLDRARTEIRSGRPWKARDRLTAAVKHDPANQELLELLGQVYFEMGDLPNAGRFWLLTSRKDNAADTALSAFEERWGGNLGEKLKMVPIDGSIEDYPPLAQDRIRRLQDAARRADIEWPRASRPQASVDESLAVDDGMLVREWLLGAVLVIIGPGLWLLGIAAAIYLLINWQW